MKRLATVFALGSLACEFQRVYILLSVGGSIFKFYSPKLAEKLSMGSTNVIFISLQAISKMQIASEYKARADEKAQSR